MNTPELVSNEGSGPNLTLLAASPPKSEACSFGKIHLETYPMPSQTVRDY